MSKDRFISPRLEVSPRQVGAKSELVTPLASLDVKFTRDQMIVNALAAIKGQGELVDLRNKPKISDPDYHILEVPSLSPWGERDLTIMAVDDTRPRAFHDMRRKVTEASFASQGVILRMMLEETGASYWGQNFSAAAIGEDNKGLQSVLSAHTHVFTFSGAQSGLTPAEISKIRDGQVYDEGISRALGNHDAKRVEQEVLPFYWNGRVKPDAMGYTINLPGYTPEHLGAPDFMTKLYTPLAHIHHHTLRDLHPQVFMSDLDNVIDDISEKTHQDQVDLGRFNNFFKRADLAVGAPNHVVKMHELYDELRRPAGWTMGIQFTGEGAFLAVSYGVLNIPLGPVESMGVQLRRPKDPVSKQEMAKRNQFYNSYIEAQLQRAA